MTRARSGEISAILARASSVSPSSTRRMTANMLSPGKAIFSVTSSYRMAPSAKMSERRSRGSPATCSGDM